MIGHRHALRSDRPQRGPRAAVAADGWTSPCAAEDIAVRTIERLTFGAIGSGLSLPILALWETAIGLGLLSGRFLRATLLLLAVQMVGACLPLVLFPSETFTQAPFAPTLEGQYIIKNVILIGAAMVIGATVRGRGARARSAGADRERRHGRRPPRLRREPRSATTAGPPRGGGDRRWPAPALREPGASRG